MFSFSLQLHSLKATQQLTFNRRSWQHKKQMAGCPWLAWECSFSTAFWAWKQLPSFTSHLGPCAKLSHHILVGLSLPMVRGGEGTKPQYGERVSKHRPHVHPLSFFSPSSLFLFQLLYALKMRDNQTSVGGPSVTQSVIIKKINPSFC